VVDQIRYAKARSALEGRAPAGWALGYDCLARGAAGAWELARVTGVTPAGGFKVEFTATPGQTHEVHRADVKPHDSRVCSFHPLNALMAQKHQFKDWLEHSVHIVLGPC
jgi:hypothetical protein